MDKFKELYMIICFLKQEIDLRIAVYEYMT